MSAQRKNCRPYVQLPLAILLKRFEESAKLSCGADNGVCELCAKKNLLQIIRNCRRVRFPVLRKFVISLADFPNGFYKSHFFSKISERRLKSK